MHWCSGRAVLFPIQPPPSLAHAGVQHQQSVHSDAAVNEPIGELDTHAPQSFAPSKDVLVNGVGTRVADVCRGTFCAWTDGCPQLDAALGFTSNRAEYHSDTLACVRAVRRFYD